MNSITSIDSEIQLLNLNKSKLKAVTRTSTLFSGFAMVNKRSCSGANLAHHLNYYFQVALVEMDIDLNEDSTSEIPSLVLHLFTITTCLLIGVHLVALMISTCLLPHIETIGMKCKSSHNSLLVATSNSKNSSRSYDDPDACFINMPHQVKQSKYVKYNSDFTRELPLSKFQPYINLSWLLSNGVGIFLFLMQLAFICYIKFSQLFKANFVYISGLVIIIIVLVIFLLFSVRFYKLLIHYSLLSKKNDIEILNNEMINLNNLSKNKKFQIISSKKLQFFHRTSHDISKKSGNKTTKYPCLSSFNASKSMTNENTRSPV
jgi:calcium release-activated calcium channel protein 1